MTKNMLSREFAPNAAFQVSFARRLRHAAVAATVLLAGSLGGCAQGMSGLNGLLNPEAQKNISARGNTPADFEKGQTEKTPREINVAKSVAYADKLLRSGEGSRAVMVLARAYKQDPNHPGLAERYARAAVQMGQAQLALDVVKHAKAQGSANAKLLTTEGAALAILGKPDKAHKSFVAALNQSPSDPELQNNVALSHAMQGDARQAEAILRKAVTASKSKRVKQNLALVLGLQGRFDEAKAIDVAGLVKEKIPEFTTTTKSMLAGPTPEDITDQEPAAPQKGDVTAEPLAPVKKSSASKALRGG